MDQEKLIELFEIIKAFKNETGYKYSEIVVICSPDSELGKFKEAKNKISGNKNIIGGVEIVTNGRVDVDYIGVYHRDCLEHINDHIAEVFGVDWVNCENCHHPLNIELMDDNDEIKCIWCNAINKIEGEE